MKTKVLLLCFLLSCSLSACKKDESATSNNDISDDSSTSEENYDDAFDIESIKSDIETRIFSEIYSPEDISYILLHSHSCSISSLWKGTSDIFLEQSYYAIPEITAVLDSYQYEYNSISFNSAVNDNSSQLITLTYYSDDKIVLLDATADSKLVSYTYDTLSAVVSGEDTAPSIRYEFINPENNNSGNSEQDTDSAPNDIVSQDPSEQNKVSNSDSSGSIDSNSYEHNSSGTGNGDGTGTGNGDNFNTYDNADQQQTEEAYVLNTKTLKIHHPTCKDVKKIAPENYETSSQSLDELKGQGYDPCGHCFK